MMFPPLNSHEYEPSQKRYASTNATSILVWSTIPHTAATVAAAVVNSLGEPELDLVLSRLGGVRPVADVASHPVTTTTVEAANGQERESA